VPIGNRRWLARWSVAAAMAIAGVAFAPGAMAQPGRPSATVVGKPPVVDATAGGAATMVLRVSLPKGVHVQAHKPDDPLLIPTVVAVTPPKGVTVTAVKYPTPTSLVQTGRAESLQVLGPEFDIDVALAIDVTVNPGALDVPVVLRYQACDDRTCFPPARAAATWRLNVRGVR
jgi:thiol:disulfide interchange protein DsbD